MDSYDNFMTEISKMGEYSVKIKENKPSTHVPKRNNNAVIENARPLALLSKRNDNYELRLVEYVEKFQNFENIENVQYDNENKKLILPIDKLDEVMESFKNKCSGYYINNGKSGLFQQSETETKIVKFTKNDSLNEIRQQSIIIDDSTANGN